MKITNLHIGADHFYSGRISDNVSKISGIAIFCFSRAYESVKFPMARMANCLLSNWTWGIATGTGCSSLIKSGFKFESATLLTNAIFIAKIITPVIFLALILVKSYSLLVSLGHKMCLENIAAKLRDSLEQQPQLSPEIHQAVLELSEAFKRRTITLEGALTSISLIRQQISSHNLRCSLFLASRQIRQMANPRRCS